MDVGELNGHLALSPPAFWLQQIINCLLSGIPYNQNVAVAIEFVCLDAEHSGVRGVVGGNG